jgi:hypothetical protein
MHAVHPEVKRVNLGVGMRGRLLSGEPSEPGDQVLERSRKDFLAHPIGFTLQDVQYSVESVLRVAANSLGGTHNDGKPNRNMDAEQLRQYMESGGATWFGRSMPAAFVFEIACCTLRACEPLANELARLGLYLPAVSEWAWSADGGRRCRINSLSCNINRHSHLRRSPSHCVKPAEACRTSTPARKLKPSPEDREG